MKNLNIKDKRCEKGKANKRPSQRTPLFQSVTLTTKLQIFDLKQLSDMEAYYKAQCKAALAAYKNWQDIHAGETDMIALLYGNLEGTMLKRRAHDAVEAYWVIRLDFRKWFQRYLAENSCYPKRFS